jgi:hypothetical protein
VLTANPFPNAAPQHTQVISRVVFELNRQGRKHGRKALRDGSEGLIGIGPWRIPVGMTSCEPELLG